MKSSRVVRFRFVSVPAAICFARHRDRPENLLPIRHETADEARSHLGEGR